MSANIEAPKRKRAPSKRSLATRARIFDSAERLFAQHMFEGTSVRDIAAAADVPVALVNFHGGSKEALFAAIVARRADALAERRLEALATLKAETASPSHRDILACFIGPYLHLAETGGEQWRAYARLIAQVSADERWRAISEKHFDPTAQVFVREIATITPDADTRRIAAAFVFAVSAMLSLVTSQWRFDAMDPQQGRHASDAGAWAGFLLDYCEGGFLAALSADVNRA